MAGMESYPSYSHDRERRLTHDPIQNKNVSGEVLSAYETGSEPRFRPKSYEDAAFEGDGECLRLGVKPS